MSQPPWREEVGPGEGIAQGEDPFDRSLTQDMVYDMVFNMEAARKITANVPEKLLREAQKVTGLGITETLIEGLRILRRQRAYEEFQTLKGALDLDIDLDLTRERNRR